MPVRDDASIAEIVVSVPTAGQLFDLLGIDYACHGGMTLREACAAAALDPVYVKHSLDQLPVAVPERPNWLDEPLDTLLGELRDRRHPRLFEQLKQVASMLSEAASIAPSSTIDAVRSTFHHFCDLIEPHCVREEHVLFPVVQHLEDCWRAGEPPTMNYVGGLTRPLAGLVLEHERINAALDALTAAALVASYDGGSSAKAARAIESLAHEVREHIHLENNILFPRATALEVSVEGEALTER